MIWSFFRRFFVFFCFEITTNANYDTFENPDVTSIVFWCECGDVFPTLVFSVISLVPLGLSISKRFIFIRWKFMTVLFLDFDICVAVQALYNDVITVIDDDVSRAPALYHLIVFSARSFAMLHAIVFCGRRNYILHRVEIGFISIRRGKENWKHNT